MSSVSSIEDTEIKTQLQGNYKPLNEFPGMTNEHSTFAEADWENTKLDLLDRAVSTTTNWKLIGKNGTNAVYSCSEIKYFHDEMKENSPCVKKMTTTYINKNGAKSKTNAEIITQTENYSYNDFNKLCRTESYIEG